MSDARGPLARLGAPIPRPVLIAGGLLVAVLFALAFVAFRYPLSYCDSTGWAPNYFGELIGQAPPRAASPRGLPVTAWFGALGRIASGFRIPNAIGFVQALLLLFIVLWAGRRMGRRAPLAALLLLPAFLASALRHAIYSQTLLSEPMAVALSVTLILALLRTALSDRQALLAGAGAAVLAAIRADLAYFVPMLLLRPWLPPRPGRERIRATGMAGAGMLAAGLAIAGAGAVVGQQDLPTGRILMIAEWSQLTAAPTNPAARALETPLATRLAAEMDRQHFRTFEDAMPLARDLVKSEIPTGGLAVGRLVLYDLVNQPGVVARHRLAALQDLFASAYASYWPGYTARSAYYSTYASVFSGWSLRELDDGLYSPCTYVSDAQRNYYQSTGLAHPGVARALIAMHGWVTPYARFVLRPLVWLAIPAFGFLLARRRVGPGLAWAAAMLAVHFLLRALLVCADERYELPVDLLLIGFTAVVLGDALRLFAGRLRGPVPAGPEAGRG